MPVTLFAQLRYEALDRCFRDREHDYMLDDLKEACRKYILEKTGRDKKPATRTIHGDIRKMRSGVLGYEAPIAYDTTEGYYYSNSNFSIYHAIFDKETVKKMTEAMMMLQAFMRDNHLTDIERALVTIREKLNVRLNPRFKPVVHLENSPNVIKSGLINLVYNHIKNKKCINIRYTPFGEEMLNLTLSPYFIKEYNNRWYLIGYDHDNHRIINPAFDRMQSVQASLRPYEEDKYVDYDKLYKHVYGVTIPHGSEVQTIRFRANPHLSHYLKTKPIHPTQKIKSEGPDGVVFTLDLIINYEIKHRLHSYAADVEVLAPEALRDWVATTARTMAQMYQ